MAVVTQTSPVHRGRPDIPPLLDFSTLNMSFTGVLPRKANTSQLGSIVFQPGRDEGGDYCATKPHIVCLGNHFLRIEFSAEVPGAVMV